MLILVTEYIETSFCELASIQVRWPVEDHYLGSKANRLVLQVVNLLPYLHRLDPPDNQDSHNSPRIQSKNTCFETGRL